MEEEVAADNPQLRRWRMVLGNPNADGTGVQLDADDKGIDAALGALYEFEHTGKFDYSPERDRKGSGGKGSLSVAKWLGDIRKYFPQSVVKILQNDALKQPELQRKLMFEPEILEQATPDVHLVASLLELKKYIPAKTKQTARIVVQKVVDSLVEKLQQKTVAALSGAINKSIKNRRPKFSEIDWHTTILKNLKHYQRDYKTIIPEIKIGYGRKNRRTVKDIILCLDQSASMATSIVYSGVFATVMASLPALRTHMIAFDTEIIDLTEQLSDPVELLFGIQLGGGTDINLALSYVQNIIEKPNDTILILISDLYEGGDIKGLYTRVEALRSAGVQIIMLLALNDDGAPSYDAQHARHFAALDIPIFACTPDIFPEMMAAAINQQDLKQWASEREIALK